MNRQVSPVILSASVLRTAVTAAVSLATGLSPVLAQETGWGMRAGLLEANSEMAVADLDGKIYVLGGYPSTRISVRTVQVYDPATDSWELTTPLPRPANHPMAASVDGTLYFIGGQVTNSGGGPFLDEVHAYDPATQTWTPRANMPTARSSGVAAVIDGKIYVAGGRPPRGNDFAVYDPALDRWTALRDMPTARNHIAGAAIGGKMYVVGGRFGAGFTSAMTNVLEIYDPVSNTWATGAPMPTVRSGLNAVEANGCLHVWGGEGPDGVFAQHEVYNPLTDKWTGLENMPRPVHGVTGAAFLNGLIHLPGGGTSTGGSSGSTIHQVYGPEMSCLPTLQAGDANQDLIFDQIDLVHVLIAAKYLTGQPATWGEGDWNGAPGGSPGNPPGGDQVFNQLDITAALAGGVYQTGPYATLRPNGLEADDQTSVGYDANTGEIWVDPPVGIELTSINIDSAAGIFTGAAAEDLGGSFDNDSDGNIFKATFGGSFGALSFGYVAAPGLAEDFVLTDLRVIGSRAGGGGLGDVDLVYVPVPEPSSLALAFGLLGMLLFCRRRHA